MASAESQVRDWLLDFITRERLPDTFVELALGHYLPIAHQTASWRQAQSRPLALAINGAQGTGKSTLAACLRGMLEQLHGFTTAVISIDDLYSTRSARAQLAATVHPLLLTRGVPGTHEVELGIQLAETLCHAPTGDAVELPRFDKSIDDRAPRASWPRLCPPIDVLILEGWCVGARPQPQAALDEPINTLEAREDRDGTWRRYVNDQLGGRYQQLFAKFDHLIMLRAPTFECVHAWRGEQERKLRARVLAAGKDLGRVMDDAALARFIMHYERLTRWMLAELPSRADVVIGLNPAHGVESVGP